MHNEVNDVYKKLKSDFESEKTFDIRFRIELLERLKVAIIKNENDIVKALKSDLNKSQMEAYTTEIGILTREINYTIKHVKKWAKEKKVKSTVLDLGSKGVLIKEPYGVTLIIGAWNYPFQLTLLPLVGAIAAGNTAVVKPSEISAASSGVIRQIIQDAFGGDFVNVVEGGIEASDALMACPFDKIFFTGSPRVGKIIMEKAAKHLTPVTLEMGGKSPCVIDENVNMATAVKRILWGKYMNVGQTCIAPDYVIVHEKVKDQFYKEAEKSLEAFYGSEPDNSSDYGRIINARNHKRLVSYLEGEQIVVGGEHRESDLYIEPTIVEIKSLDSRLMDEEIFGPILPVVTFRTIEDLKRIIRYNPDPLAFYVFSNDKQFSNELIKKMPFGGGCVNGTVMHIMNHNLPFGGRGSSGIGNYHGQHSFEAFSHTKSVLKSSLSFDMSMIYPPFGDKHNFVKKFVLK